MRDIKRVTASIEAAGGEWFAAIGNQHEALMSQLDRIDATIDRIEDRLSRWGGKPSGLAPVGSGPEAGAWRIGAGSCPRRNEQIGPSASTTETRERWTLERFLAWEENQPDRYELVYGRPRLLTGETAAHSQVKNNIVTFLRSALQEEPWRVLGGDLRIPVPATGSCRYPDAAIDCGIGDPMSRGVRSPAVVFEVFSVSDDSQVSSDEIRDWHDRLGDYDTVDAIQTYVTVYVESEPFVAVFRRNRSGHLCMEKKLSERSSVLRLDPLGIDLPLAAIFDGVWPETAPTGDGSEPAADADPRQNG
jgi:Uma2 family endonuclease